MSVPRKRLMARLQTLIGRARAIYEDDRQPDRAGAIEEALDEAWRILLHLNDGSDPRRKEITMAEYLGITR